MGKEVTTQEKITTNHLSYRRRVAGAHGAPALRVGGAASEGKACALR